MHREGIKAGFLLMQCPSVTLYNYETCHYQLMPLTNSSTSRAFSYVYILYILPHVMHVYNDYFKFSHTGTQLAHLLDLQ